MTSETVIGRMERCAALARERPPESVRELLALLRDDEDWSVRYAAAVALGDLAEPSAATGLLEALAAEEAEPLYTQPHDTGGMHGGAIEAPPPEFPPGTTRRMRLAWQRRGRIKQAVILALGAIGATGDAVLAALHRHATDSSEDAAVRAAACKALGVIGGAESTATLKAACQDTEWCTSCEARKALAACEART